MKTFNLTNKQILYSLTLIPIFVILYLITAQHIMPKHYISEHYRGPLTIYEQLQDKNNIIYRTPQIFLGDSESISPECYVNKDIITQYNTKTNNTYYNLAFYGQTPLDQLHIIQTLNNTKQQYLIQINPRQASTDYNIEYTSKQYLQPNLDRDLKDFYKTKNKKTIRERLGITKNTLHYTELNIIRKLYEIETPLITRHKNIIIEDPQTHTHSIQKRFTFTDQYNKTEHYKYIKQLDTYIQIHNITVKYVIFPINTELNKQIPYYNEQNYHKLIHELQTEFNAEYINITLDIQDYRDADHFNQPGCNKIATYLSQQ